MPYLPLPNFNHDSGPRRIQSGPDHEGYVVLYSGVQATGPDEGIVVAGSPLSGTLAAGAWDYDDNWRYVPGALPTQSGSALDPTPYNVSGALDTYDGTRIATRTSVAGAQAASAIGPEANVLLPRQAPLQPRADVTRPEKYMYFGGAAPDNQNYSPYNTPDANTAAEGKTGGPVTHRTYENTLITNILGSQGTSDRSQWRYHQPVYCKTYTETVRSDSPGLMSTPLRYVYRGHATQYNLNYPLGNGFQQLPYDDQTGGCGIPVGCPTKSGSATQIIVGDVLSAVVYCVFDKIEWFNTNGASLGTGLTYTAASSDVGYKIYYVVTYPDGSTDTSSVDCYSAVIESSLRYWYQLASANTITWNYIYSSVIDNNGDMYVAYAEDANSRYPAVAKVTNEVNLVWRTVYVLDPSFYLFSANSYANSYYLLDSSDTTIDFLAWQWSLGRTFPIRVYRCKVNKSDGSLVSTVAKDWIPPGSPSDNYFNITNVKIDSDNNYYMVANLAINSETSTPCIVKFNENLDIQWCLVPQRVKYRNPGSGPVCSYSNSDGSHSLEVSDSGLIGCGWRNSFEYIYSNYYSLSPNGSVLSVFKSKFSTADFVNDTNPFNVRSLCRDSEGNVYGIGSYDNSIAVGRFSSVIIYKDSPSDVTIWAKDIRNTFYSPPRYTINLKSNQLLLVDSKLVLVAPWQFDISGSTIHYLLICVFNASTGNMDQAVEIRPPGEISDDLMLQSMPETTKFFVRSSAGFTLRLDVNNLPANGEYVCSDDPSAKYTASGVTPVTNNATFYKFDGCGSSSAPGFASRDLSSYFFDVASPVVTASGATNGTFRYFAGQDTP